MENMTKIENTIPFIAPLGRELVISGAYMQALVVQQSANEFGACLVHTDVADIAQGTCRMVHRDPTPAPRMPSKGARVSPRLGGDATYIHVLVCRGRKDSTMVPFWLLLF